MKKIIISFALFSSALLSQETSYGDAFLNIGASSRSVALGRSVVALPQNVGGYLVSPDNKHCPIFVNYHKEENISESTKYEDEFVNNKEFDWMSKSNRKLGSNDVQSILGNKGFSYLD